MSSCDLDEARLCEAFWTKVNGAYTRPELIQIATACGVPGTMSTRFSKAQLCNIIRLLVAGNVQGLPKPAAPILDASRSCRDYKTAINNAYTKKELIQIGKRAKLPVTWRMTKDQLCDILTAGVPYGGRRGRRRPREEAEQKQEEEEGEEEESVRPAVRAAKRRRRASVSQLPQQLQQPQQPSAAQMAEMQRLMAQSGNIPLPEEEW